MQSPLIFFKQIFMHYFSVGVSNLCLNVSMQVSKHLELRQMVSYWLSIKLLINQLNPSQLIYTSSSIHIEIIMSLVQIAYQTLITKIREWGKLQGKEQLQLLQQASCLFGQPFRKALNLIEKNPQRLQIYDYDHFYLLIINSQKYLLFKSNSKARLNDCTCKSSWLRKVGEKAPYMCFHQIVLELSLSLFPNKMRVQKINCTGTAELAEYLQAIE